MKIIRNNSMVLLVTTLQYFTVIFLFFSPTVIKVASLGLFYNLFTIPQIGGLLLTLGIISAVFGLFFSKSTRYHFFFFILQYIFLLLTAGSSLNYIIAGHYADGVIRPWQFIFVDQLPYLIITILYTLEIFNFKSKEELVV